MLTVERRFSSSRRAARYFAVASGTVVLRKVMVWPGLAWARTSSERLVTTAEDGVAGGDAAAAVQHQEFLPGRHLDGSHRDAAGEHFGARLAFREGPAEAQADVVAPGADGVFGGVEQVRGVAEFVHVRARP